MKKIMAIVMLLSTFAAQSAEDAWDNLPRPDCCCDFSKDGIYYTIMETDSTHLAVCHNEPDYAKIWSLYKNTEPLTVYTGDVVVPEFVEHDGVKYTVVAVGHYAFANNTLLRSVTLPPSVTAIDDGAFRNCTALESVNLSDTITIIGKYAFYNTPKLPFFPLPSDLVNLAPGAYDDNFYGEYHVPTTIIQIEGFPDCSRIVFGDYGVHDNYIYYYPDFFRREINPSPVPDNNNGGTQLKEIVLPTPYFRMSKNSLSSSSLERVILPEIEKMRITKPAFTKCPNLKEFVSLSAIPPKCTYPYGLDSEEITEVDYIDLFIGWLDDYSGVTLVVPEGSEEAYAADQVWGRFQTIKGDPEIGRYLLSANERISADRTEHGFTVSAESGALTVSAPEPTEIEIFIPTGVCVKRLSVCDETRIPLHGGIYLITDHRTTRKARVK